MNNADKKFWTQIKALSTDYDNADEAARDGACVIGDTLASTLQGSHAVNDTEAVRGVSQVAVRNIVQHGNLFAKLSPGVQTCLRRSLGGSEPSDLSLGIATLAPVAERPLAAPFRYPMITGGDSDFSERTDAAYATLRDYGYRVSSVLGCGAYGCAYLGEPYVVKLTTDPEEAANAQRVMALGNDLPGIVQYRAVFAITQVPGVYAIVMEPLDALTEAESAWVDEHRLDWTYAQARHHEITPRQRDAAIAKALASAPRSLDTKPFVAALKTLAALGMHVRDGHSDNVMKRKNVHGKATLVMIDLGGMGTPGADLPALPPLAGFRL